MDDWRFDEDRGELPIEGEGLDENGFQPIEAPLRLEMLPTGDEALVAGDPEGYRDLNHLQGDNPFGFQSTCGLVSCEGVLKQFGVETSEAEVVQHAIEHGLCATGGDDVAVMGGTTMRNQAQILTDFGVPATETSGRSLDDLALNIECRRGVIIEVNAGVLWNDPNYYHFGEVNHAVTVTGVARDPETGTVFGAFVNDSGRGFPEDSGRFIDTATLEAGWIQPGGKCVITDIVNL